MIICVILFSSISFNPGLPVASNKGLEWELELRPEAEFLEVQVKAYNSSSKTITLEFPSSKYFDYIISNAQGEKVYQYSDDKAFLQAIQRISIESGQTKIWKDQWDYHSGGKRIPPGKYSVKAVLQVKSINGKPADIEKVRTDDFTAGMENPSFRKIDLKASEGHFHVKGEAKVSAGCFYYTVEDGHNILVEETLVKVNKEYPNWVNFTFSFELDPAKIPDNRPVMVNLYERDLKDGTIYHMYSKRLK